MDLFKTPEKLKLVELYSVLLILCTGLMVFGMFQMQAAMSAALTGGKISSTATILQAVQVAALGVVLSTVIMVLFFRRLRKSLLSQAKEK